MNYYRVNFINAAAIEQFVTEHKGHGMVIPIADRIAYIMTEWPVERIEHSLGVTNVQPTDKFVYQAHARAASHSILKKLGA